jgi:hypothetical protein
MNDEVSNIHRATQRTWRHRWPWRLLVALVLAAEVPSGAVVAGRYSRVPTEPYVLRAGKTAVGLVYTPEVLQLLVRRASARDVDVRISDAIRNQTPIVVMWSVPVPSDVGPEPPPYTVVIIAGSDDARNVGGRITPLWVEHDASSLAALDNRVTTHQVGAVAAFPRSAFVKGRIIDMYSDYPPNAETGEHRGVHRSAPIQFEIDARGYGVRQN